MSTAKKMFTFDFIHQPRLYKSEDIARGISKSLDELDAIFVSAKSKIKAIKDSGTYTAAGKKIELAELAKEIARQVQDWEKVIDGYNEFARQLNEEMQPKRNREDDVVGEMRQAEIRVHLRSLDPLQAEAEFMIAAERGDETFLAAIEESPIEFTFSTKDLIEKVKFRRLSAAYPEQAQKVADLRVATHSATSALKTVGNELAKEGVNILADPISRAQAA